MAPGKRLTLEEFKQRVQEAQPNKINLSKVTEYKNAHTKVTCICNSCNYEWLASPLHLMNKVSPTSCPKCAGRNKTTEEFITLSREKFPNKYDYRNVIYVNQSTPVILIEIETAHIFEVSPEIHLRNNSLGGCKECQRNEISKRFSYSKNDFVEKAREVHNDRYNYTSSDYIDSQTKILIWCPIHGFYEQAPASHLSGCGCPQCGIESSRNSKFLTEEEIKSKLLECLKIHNSIYTYIRIFTIDARLFVEAVCKTHGCFTQRLDHHINGSRCQYCHSNYSRKQIEWLNFRMLLDGNIQHAENGGEFRIPKTKWLADGFNAKTNTIYEFQGDFWHGNPELFDKDEINPKTGISFGDLNKKTKNKNDILIKMGFNVIEIWESQWDRAIKLVKIIQRKWRLSKSN